jgi:two-component system, NtrC family, nitrogen regulation response regulator GlnG
MARVLIVDDENTICWGLSQLAEGMGHEYRVASSAEAALEEVKSFKPDVALLDVRLPGRSGLNAMPELRELIPEAPIIVMTAFGDLSTAVDAVKQGAYEYLVKPFELDHVERVVTQALSKRSRPNSKLAAMAESAPAGGLVGQSAVMRELYHKIALASGSEASVLLQGESGTGKELAARAIHEHGPRREGRFVAVNVAALNPSLAESELFGHMRGAFTGADSPREGLLKLADGGTLFLDEVADIPLGLQVKLLRALEYREILPVGASEPITSNFRLVAATHQNLAERAAAGMFRRDLFYRLSAFQIHLPALRERIDDIGPLVRHFIQLLGEPGAAPIAVSKEAMKELESRKWHGNVRELRNVVEHALIVARNGPVMPWHLPPTAIEAPPTPEADAESRLAALITAWAESQMGSKEEITNLHERLWRLVEPSLFAAALRKSHGQYLAAGKLLGLHRVTLRKRCQEYGLGGSED